MASQDETPPRTPQAEETSKEVTLTGENGRPEFSKKKNIALWEAGLQVTEENGDKRWIDIQTWRKNATNARDNVERAQVVTVVGKRKHEEWTGKNGHDRERDIFVVSYFKEDQLAAIKGRPRWAALFRFTRWPRP